MCIQMHEMSGSVYFCKTPDNLIYIGWSEAPSKRMRDHINSGRTLLAARPGTGGAKGTDEYLLHDFFEPYRVRPSQYQGEKIFDYVTWLLERGYATKLLDDVRKLQGLPLEVWSPRRSGNPEPAIIDNQLNLFGPVTPRSLLSAIDRPVYAHALPHLSSESDEWYTPESVISKVRNVFGGEITTDPSSDIVPQEWIRAKYWYTKNCSGLYEGHPWKGSVWLNPPYGRGENSASSFIERLIREIGHKSIVAAITCLNLNSMGSLWFKDVWDNASIHLIWRGRINFVGTGDLSSSPSKGTILSYFGKNPSLFASEFAGLGTLIRAEKP